MRLAEAIETCDRLYPNSIDAADKVAWVSSLDHSVWEEIIQTREDAVYEETDTDEEIEDTTDVKNERPVLKEFVPYIYGVDDEKTLVITSPYEELYTDYLCAKTAQFSNDLTAYSNFMTAFNSLYGEYAAWYNRKHMPRCDHRIKV